MIVADSQSIYWYLLAPERLTSLAVGALESAEGEDGIMVSAWTVPELWLATSRKRGSKAIPLSAYELVRTTLLDPDTSIHVEPFSQRMWPHFELVSTALRDPFDCAIVATARVLDVPLVSSDIAIAEAGLVQVVW